MINIKVNTEIIKSLNPCMDRLDNYLNYYRDFEGDLIEFLQLDNLVSNDKIWVAVRLMPSSLVRMFADTCANNAYIYESIDTNPKGKIVVLHPAHIRHNLCVNAVLTAIASSPIGFADVVGDAAHLAACSAAAVADGSRLAAYNKEREGQVKLIIKLLQDAMEEVSKGL